MKLTNDEIEFMLGLDDTPLSICNHDNKQKELIEKLIKNELIKIEDVGGFKNYFYFLTEKARKKYKTKLKKLKEN